MTNAALYTTAHRFYLNGKEVFGDDQKLCASLFGAVTTKELLVATADGKSKNKAYNAAYELAAQGGFSGVVTRVVYS